MLLSSADFFQNESFQKILSGIISECQTADLGLNCLQRLSTTTIVVWPMLFSLIFADV